MKKQLIKIKPIPGSLKPNYKVCSVSFSFVSSPATERTQLTDLVVCREYATRDICRAINGETKNKLIPPFDFSKLRLLLVNDPPDVDVFKRRLFSGKAALNILEGINNWDQSSITTVNHPYYKNAWLLTGPPEWLHHPQLFSLATWILRLSTYYGILDTNNFDSLEKNLYKIMCDGNGRTTDETTYINKFWNKLFIIFEYYKEIFGDIDFEHAWPDIPDIAYLWIHGGLQTFVDGTATYSKDIVLAYKKFEELCIKHLPRTTYF